jgi:hypothetical protein
MYIKITLRNRGYTKRAFQGLGLVRKGNPLLQENPCFTRSENVNVAAFGALNPHYDSKGRSRILRRSFRTGRKTGWSEGDEKVLKEVNGLSGSCNHCKHCYHSFGYVTVVAHGRIYRLSRAARIGQKCIHQWPLRAVQNPYQGRMKIHVHDADHDPTGISINGVSPAIADPMTRPPRTRQVRGSPTTDTFKMVSEVGFGPFQKSSCQEGDRIPHGSKETACYRDIAVHAASLVVDQDNAGSLWAAALNHDSLKRCLEIRPTWERFPHHAG